MRHEDKLALVHAFYEGLCAHLQIAVPATDAAGKLVDINAWLDAVDARCEVHQLRTYLLTREVAPDTLRAVLDRHLQRKASKGSADNKLDLLLVHFLAQSMTSFDADLTVAEAAQALAPVLGPVETAPPPAVLQLQADLACTNELRDLLERNMLQRVRQCRADYSGSPTAALVLFAWLSLIVRRTCVRLVMSDLDQIEKNCRQLRSRGITELRSGAKGQETVETLEALEQKCVGWRRPFAGKYYDDSWFRAIAAAKTGTEDALRPAAGSQPAATLPEQARPQPAPASSKAEPQPKPAPRQKLIEVITEALKNIRSKDFARVQIGKAAVLLSSAEIRAFRAPGEPASALLREIVAARADVAEALRGSDPNNLDRAKAAAVEVLHNAHQTIEGMKQDSNSETGINLLASARALEKALGQKAASAKS